jgi:hypothetical protein
LPVVGLHVTVLQSRFTHVTGFGSRTQTPPWQRSCGVHLLLSASHAVPSALAVGMQPPCPSQVLAVVHAPTSQVYAVPTQVPAALRTSPLVHGLPSSHAAPGFGVTLQVDVPSHSRVADSSLMQTTVAPAQAPFALHASPYVHSRLSLQAVPTGFTGLLHWPVLSLQTPGSWH